MITRICRPMRAIGKIGTGVDLLSGFKKIFAAGDALLSSLSIRLGATTGYGALLLVAYRLQSVLFTTYNISSRASSIVGQHSKKLVILRRHHTKMRDFERSALPAGRGHETSTPSNHKVKTYILVTCKFKTGIWILSSLTFLKTL